MVNGTIIERVGKFHRQKMRNFTLKKYNELCNALKENYKPVAYFKLNYNILSMQ